jgi:DNA-binding MarR family transcriptional regulator
MHLFPPVTRGMRRWQDGAAPAPVPSALSPRHVAALEQIRGGPLTVGELASRLGLTLPTVSGVLADLDRAGLVERRPDPADRRRTIVQIIPAQATLIGHWLDAPPNRWPACWTSSPPASRKPSSRPWTCSKPSCTGRTPAAEPAIPGPASHAAHRRGHTEPGLNTCAPAALTTQTEQLRASPSRIHARPDAARSSGYPRGEVSQEGITERLDRPEARATRSIRSGWPADSSVVAEWPDPTVLGVLCPARRSTVLGPATRWRWWIAMW